MVSQNGICSASHPAVHNIYLCIIEEMLTVFKTLTTIQKLRSAYMKKVSILSVKNECVGIILSVVTKPA